MDLSSAPATLFSPAKLVYIGYIVLAALGRIEVSVTQFMVVSALFLVVQVYHDDYLRIVLNGKAEKRAKG